MPFLSKVRAIPVALAFAAMGVVLYVGSPADDTALSSPPPSSALPASRVAQLAGPRRDELEPHKEFIVETSEEPSGPLVLEGQVVSDDESPAAGVEVVVDARPSRTAVTEADGSFTFTGLLPRRYTLVARNEASAAGPVSVQLQRDTPPVILRLRDAGSVEVSVVNERTGTALAGALVTLRGIAESARTSDAAGLVVFDAVIGGTYLIAVTAPGYAPVQTQRFLLGQVDTVERVLVPMRAGVAVRGTVVDDAGRPVPEALVSAVGASVVGVQVEALRGGVVSDAAGTWSIPALGAGTYRLTVVHADHPVEIGPLITVVDSPIDGIALRVSAGCRLRGTVRTRQGEPVVGARVAAAPHGVRAIPAVGREAVTDQAGRFDLAGLRAGEANVVAQTSDAAAATVRVALRPDVPADVAIVLDQEETIRGTVNDAGNGEPVAEAVVVARPVEIVSGDMLRGEISTIADDDGGFELRGLQRGMRYLLYAAHPGQVASNAVYGVRALATVPAGSRDVHLNIAVQRVIRGRALVRGVGPPSLFSVAFGARVPVPFATRDGSFSLRGVAPGEYYLRIDGTDFQRRTLIIQVPSDRDVDLGIVELTAGRRLTGVVINVTRQAVAGARVMFGARLVTDVTSGTRLAGDDFAARETITDADGMFSLDGVGDGVGVLIADHPDQGRSRAVAVPAGSAEPLTVVLEPTGDIAGIVVEGGRGAPGVSVVLDAVPDSGNTLMAVTDSSGTFSLSSIVPGQYRAAAVIPQEGTVATRVAKLVNVKAGIATQLELIIPSGGVTLLIDPQVDGRPVREGQLVLTSQRLEEDGDAAAIIGERRPIRLERVQPGSYLGCIVPAVAAGRLLDTDELRGLRCRQLTVATEPAQQFIVLDVPSAPH